MTKILILILLLCFFISITDAKLEKTDGIKHIDLKIQKGLNYLYDSQLPNGEFPMNLSFSQDMSQSSNVVPFFGNVPIIFDTGLILHTLNLADKKDKKVIEMKNKAITFLLNNKERHNVWRFFGKDHSIPPDTDDTSVVFSALVESGVNISDESLDYMLNYRTPDDKFYVWINSEEWLSPSNPYYRQKWILNEVDPGVNADVLYAYSLRKRTQTGVIKYIKEIIENRSFKNGSEYYPSPYVFTYLITKAYSDGNVKRLRPYLNDIKEYLLETQYPDGGWGNDLNTALATNALINMGYKGNELEKAIIHILYSQENNGNWDIYGLYTAWEHPSPTVYFGSKATTTSYSIEALIKYKKIIIEKAENTLTDTILDKGEIYL